jgi:hypothetical protein
MHGPCFHQPVLVFYPSINSVTDFMEFYKHQHRVFYWHFLFKAQ